MPLGYTNDMPISGLFSEPQSTFRLTIFCWFLLQGGVDRLFGSRCVFPGVNLLSFRRMAENVFQGCVVRLISCAFRVC